MKKRRGRLNITGLIDNEKMYKIAAVKEQKKPNRLEIECWALIQAKKLGINVPQVIDYYRNDKGQEVLILERINGGHIYHFTSQEKIFYMRSVGSQMMSLVNPSEGFGWINSQSKKGISSKWGHFICSYAEIYGRRLVNIDVISGDNLKKVIKMLSVLDLDIKIPYLVNRDIKPGNILRDAEEKIWIVDWENVILGDPLYDLAIFGGSYGHGFLWEGLSQGYGLSVSSSKYRFYQIVALFGIIDFCVKYKVPYLRRQQRLQYLLRTEIE